MRREVIQDRSSIESEFKRAIASGAPFVQRELNLGSPWWPVMVQTNESINFNVHGMICLQQSFLQALI